MKNENNITVSRFRKGFYAQSYIFLAGIVAGSVLIFILLHKKFPGVLTLAVTFLIFVAGLWAYKKLFFDFFIQVRIDPEKIIFRHVYKQKQDVLTYPQIKNINFDAFQIENLNGPLTESVPETVIESKNGTKYYLSSNIYENFTPLLISLLQHYNKYIDLQIEDKAKEIFKKITGYDYGKQQ